MWFRLFIINLPYKSIAQRHTYKKNAFSHTASKTYNEIQRTASSFRPVCWKIGDIHPSFSLVRCDGRHSRDTSSHDLKRDIAAAGTVGARREKHHQPATSWFVLVRRRRVSWCPRTYRPAWQKGYLCRTLSAFHHHTFVVHTHRYTHKESSRQLAGGGK